MPQLLYLVRHLPTPWNIDHKLQGRADIDLVPPNAETLSLIAQRADVLRSIANLKTFSSPRRRAAETARLYGFPAANLTDELIEFDFGDFEGSRRSEFLKTVGPDWFENPGNVVMGEAVTDLGRRVSGFLGAVSDYDAVAVFGHGCWIRAAISLTSRGNLSAMNKVTVPNNAMIQIDFSQPVGESRIRFL